MNAKTLRGTVYLVIFALVTIFLTYVLAVTITNGSVGSTRSYKAEFSDATGLLVGDDVRIAGVRVGQIRSVKIAHHCPTGSGATSAACALVTFGLDKRIPLHQSAHAALKYRNLVGQRYLDVEDAPGTEAVAPKDFLIPLSRTSPALDLTVLFDGFRPLFNGLNPQDVNSVAYEIVQTLQGEGGTIDTLLASTASLSTSVAAQDAAIGSLIDNLTGVVGTVDARKGELTNLIDQLQRLTTGLAGDRNAIASSLANVDKLATSTTTLISSIRPELPTDLAQLSGVANNLATSTSNQYATGVGNTLDQFLQHFPGKINSIIKTATFGSYFNFYACTLDVALGNLGAAGPTLQVKSTNTFACLNTGGH